MYDVIIIGGGICGTSVFYELSRYNAKILLVEKENDIAMGTTKANSGIIHAGYDPAPNTKMAKYNVEGNHIIKKRCKQLDVSFKQIGSLVLGFNENDRKTIEKLYNQGLKNGVPYIEILNKEDLFKLEPNLNKNAIVALHAPTAGVIAPWELALAQTEIAVNAGGNVSLSSEVINIIKENNYFNVITNKGEFKCKYLINAAGVYSDKIAKMLGDYSFKISPSRGEYFLLDKGQSDIVSHVIFQCPTKEGKGVLVSPTSHNTLIVGPNSENVSNIDDLSCTKGGLEQVRSSAVKSVPNIDFSQTIRNFSGLRAVSEHSDFIIGPSDAISNFYNIAGIKSPGLTAAPAIAKDIVKYLHNDGFTKEENINFINKREYKVFSELNSEEKADIIKKNPLYASVVCRCFCVTEGEIIDMLHRPLPPKSLDGIKRRCGAGMGRCQGGFCGPKVQAIISKELGINPQDVVLDNSGSFIISGETKSTNNCTFNN